MYENKDYSSCGVGFIVNKSGRQTFKLLKLASYALSQIPHRGGKNTHGVGDGSGVQIDLSVNFYRYLSKNKNLIKGSFAIANFFYPKNETAHGEIDKVTKSFFNQNNIKILHQRFIEVNPDTISKKTQQSQLPIRQFVLLRPTTMTNQDRFEKKLYQILLDIEKTFTTQHQFDDFYPISISSYTQVYKARLSSNELTGYFKDLYHSEHRISQVVFHNRFSTNTEPTLAMSQPFRMIAHNGEINTYKKNRLNEYALYQARGEDFIIPKGQSDSCLIDQMIHQRAMRQDTSILQTITSMMPPAWENDLNLPQNIRSMYAYFSLHEEKIDGPAALIFSDGKYIGARLDRLGLRPLRTMESKNYLLVASEAGLLDLKSDQTINYGKVGAGQMIAFDLKSRKVLFNEQIIDKLSRQKDYHKVLKDKHIHLSDVSKPTSKDWKLPHDLSLDATYMVYGLNRESFKFLVDPMFQSASEKITAMGYDVAPNVLNAQEGGMSRYFSQRFSQVTNPPLDSVREIQGMSLKVALGSKPDFGRENSLQIILNSPVLTPNHLNRLKAQKHAYFKQISILFTPSYDVETNQKNLKKALDNLCTQVESLVRGGVEIIILDDHLISQNQAPIPAILAIAAVTRHLIKTRLRFLVSLICSTFQAVSSHDIACLLGFGASAVCPVASFHRAYELYGENHAIPALLNYKKGIEKALLKTMAKFGLCTVESYIGGEFFEANFIDTQSTPLNQYFPNIDSPIAGVRFSDIATSAQRWHDQGFSLSKDQLMPILGLFKERSGGLGHTFGNIATRQFGKMTEENLSVKIPDTTKPYKKEYIDSCQITSKYLDFCKQIDNQRAVNPAALRDILALPMDFSCHKSEFIRLFDLDFSQNAHFYTIGLDVQKRAQKFICKLHKPENLDVLFDVLKNKFSDSDIALEKSQVIINHAQGDLERFLNRQRSITPIAIEEVEKASTITQYFATGAMSCGALTTKAHRAVSQGANLVGALSNSGEGGEAIERFNSIYASKVKQFASGRFGVWTGYLADPHLKEIEIKIAQGAKPGEGGQLPGAKVTLEIATLRGGVPTVELVSPPPHHDTYSIEDLSQLIHDAKAAGVKVGVKLVSSEGVGIIAVGVAKAGADVINIAGNSGGTGAASVTSVKHTGRIAEIGISQVHQALVANGLRQKVVLRASNSHQTALDIVKSALLGADSFEFGTSALMMLGCVMAKTCNIKCPTGLTTNPELYQGDSRKLAQYFINTAHKIREYLALLGAKSLGEICGRGDLLHLVSHLKIVGRLDIKDMLKPTVKKTVNKSTVLERRLSPRSKTYKIN